MRKPLYSRLYSLAARIKGEATYQEMKYYFKLMLKNKEPKSYLKPVRIYDRASGKSTSLAKLAVKYDLSIIVPTSATKRYYESNIFPRILKIKPKNIPRIYVANTTDKLRGIRFDYVLVDEGVNDECFKYIQECTLKGVLGFYKSNY